MRILHTSDWHLGRSFHGASLHHAHEAFLEDLVSLVRSERVGAVLVSGDVYDRALPGPTTVALLSDALTRLVDAGAHVVLTSGNHDSAIRLGFAAGLLSRAGVHVRTAAVDVGRPVLLEDLAVYPLPYLEPALVAEQLGAADRAHTAVLTAAMSRVRRDVAQRSARSLVMAHAVVSGAVAGDVERDIAVGGVSAVSPGVFDDVAYVALGHLHTRQRVTDTIRYAGSPVALSFQEARHRKGMWLVDVDDYGTGVEPVDLPTYQPLATVRGTLSQLMSDPSLDWAEQAWCQVTLTDPIRPTAAYDTVHRRFPTVLQLQFEPDRDLPLPASRYTVRSRSESPVQTCRDFLEHVRGGRGPDEAELELLTEAVEAVRVERAGRDAPPAGDSCGADSSTPGGLAESGAA